MTPPDCGHVLIDSRALALLVTPAMLKRARWQWRGNPELYRDLVTLSVLLAVASDSKIAIPSAARDAGYVTANEYAAAAGISANAVRLACRQGRIRAVKRGRDWQIPLAELAERRLAC
jgi:hypothetical protein